MNTSQIISVTVFNLKIIPKTGWKGNQRETGQNNKKLEFLSILCYKLFMKLSNCTLVLLGLVFAVLISAPVNAQEAEYIYPRHAILNASYCGDEETVRDILACGTDKNVRDDFGDTALHVAIYQKNLMIIKLLLDYGFDPNAKTTKNGNTPLHNAVAVNNLGAARLLLQYGANRNIRALDGLTPLDRARKNENQEMVTILYR